MEGILILFFIAIRTVLWSVHCGVWEAM